MVYKAFALDFDGVIADGLNECILVSWNGFHNKTIGDFSDEGLAQVPEWFIHRFTQLRNFAKHLGHFFIPFCDKKTSIKTQDEYDQLFLSLDPIDVETFVQKVSEYRAIVRVQKAPLWLEMHTLYKHVDFCLRNLSVPTYIVSAKDSNSILKILERAKILVPPERIFGEQRKKISALKEIQRRENASSEEVFFLDDSIVNVIDAAKSNYSAFWALWGYHSESHLRLAQDHGIVSLLEEQLPHAMGIGTVKREKMNVRFLHSMIRVQDVRKTLDFYKILGLQLIRQKDYPSGKYSLYFLATEEGEPEIELTHNWDSQEYTNGTNFGHFAYRVENIYEICALLKANNISVLRPPRDGYMAFVKDPNGISIELLQANKALAPQEPWASMPNTGSW